MSDSPRKEHNQTKAEESGKSPASSANPTPGGTADKARRPSKKTASSVSDTEKKITTGKQRLPTPLMILGIMAVLGLLIFAAVIGNQLLQKMTTGKETTQLTPVPAVKEQDNQPVSILPDKPDGITIVEKQPETPDPSAPVALAPVAQGSDIATGFAMDMGPADFYLELSRRFAELANLNGVENFQRLEPRAVLRETVTGLEARLLIGPFDTEKQADEACSILVLPEKASCNSVLFQGDLISRE